MRARLLDFKVQCPEESLGFCRGDTATAARYANAAQERLLFAPEGNDSGFWGGWAEVAFQVTCNAPFITTHREIARLEAINVCTYPIELNNQFVEYLRFGFGRFPKCSQNGCNGMSAYERGTFPTFSDLKPPNKIVRVYLGDPTDENKRVLIQGYDNNCEVIYSMDNGVLVEGVFLTLSSPFVDTPMEFRKVTGIQKDETNAIVKFFEVDTLTGDQRLVGTMDPYEKVASYRRYYIGGLANNRCCATTDDTPIKVTAIAKLDLIPVVNDCDYLLVQNLSALFEEAKSYKASCEESPNARENEIRYHKKAIGFLNGELIHREGKLNPATIFSPFGSASLAYQGFGRMK